MALSFMAIVTVGATGLAVAILHGNTKSQDVGTASDYTQDCLETIRNTAYASIATSTCDAKPLDPKFTRAVTVQNDTPVSGVKRILVIVSWGAGSVTKETLVTQ